VVVEPTEGRCCAEVRFVVVFFPSQPPIQILSSVCRYEFISEDDIGPFNSSISSKLKAKNVEIKD
jgi:hypothetical protein